MIEQQQRKRVFDVPRYSVSRAILTREEKLAKKAARERKRRLKIKTGTAQEKQP